jgi:elongation factor P
VALPASLLGPQAKFLQADLRLTVEFVEDRPVGVVFPDTIEVRIADTAPAVHQQSETTFKAATLASGVEVMVPQFIKIGDLIRLDLKTLKYMDRVKPR